MSWLRGFYCTEYWGGKSPGLPIRLANLNDQARINVIAQETSSGPVKVPEHLEELYIDCTEGLEDNQKDKFASILCMLQGDFAISPGRS